LYQAILFGSTHFFYCFPNIERKKVYYSANNFTFIMTPSIPFAWIGTTELNTAGEDAGSSGPIGQAVQDRAFNRIILLSDYTSIEEQRYCSWLKTKTLSEIVIMHHDLSSPMHFGEIYEAARGFLDQNRQEADHNINVSFESRHVGDGGGLDPAGQNVSPGRAYSIVSPTGRTDRVVSL
jgi:hypothetical protein